MWKIKNQYFQCTQWDRIYSLSPSNYIRKGTLQVFQKIRREYPADHILCIGYEWGDTQFGITETFKTHETTADQVVDRCLMEELSMERTDKTSECRTHVYQERFATIYCVPMRVSADNLRSCAPQSTDDDANKDDDKTRKLVLLLHGPFEVIRQIFSSFASTEKEITHLVSIPVNDIVFMFPKLFLLPVKPMKSFLSKIYELKT